MTLKVTPTDVTIIHSVPAALGADGRPNEDSWSERTTVCAFGPKPATNARPMRQILCSAKWDGDSLIVTETPDLHPPVPNSGTDTTYAFRDGLLTATWVVPGNDHGRKPITEIIFFDKAK